MSISKKPFLVFTPLTTCSYDLEKKDFIPFVIDDHIPVHKREWYHNEARPLFSKPNGNELYILLLEKAFAKFAGNYEELDGGHSAHAWTTLTGCEEIETWSFDNGNWLYGKVDIDGRREKYPRGFGKLSYTYPMPRPEKGKDDFFTYLKDCDEKQFIMGARP